MNIDEVVKKVTEEVYKQMGACANAEKPAECSTELAGHIEHSILNPDMTRAKVIAECALAKQYKFANVCASMPCVASITKTAPSQAYSALLTS